MVSSADVDIDLAPSAPAVYRIKTGDISSVDEKQACATPGASILPCHID